MHAVNVGLVASALRLPEVKLSTDPPDVALIKSQFKRIAMVMHPDVIHTDCEHFDFAACSAKYNELTKPAINKEEATAITNVDRSLVALSIAAVFTMAFNFWLCEDPLVHCLITAAIAMLKLKPMPPPDLSDELEAMTAATLPAKTMPTYIPPAAWSRAKPACMSANADVDEGVREVTTADTEFEAMTVVTAPARAGLVVPVYTAPAAWSTRAMPARTSANAETDDGDLGR